MSDDSDGSYDGEPPDREESECSSGNITPRRDSTPLPDAAAEEHIREEVEEDALALVDNSTHNPLVLIAHMLDTSSSPLTRRRFQSTAIGIRAAQLRARPEAQRQEVNAEEDEVDKQTCIVCYTEPRTIVCWPCRCLAMCDDCRSSMATLPMKQHLCPTCRTP